MNNYNRPGGNREHYDDHYNDDYQDNHPATRHIHFEDPDYRFGDRLNQENNWDEFASDRDRYINNSNDNFRDSRRRGYQHSGGKGLYASFNAPVQHRNNDWDAGGRNPARGGSSSHSGTFYHMENSDGERERAKSFSANWNGSSNHPGNNAQRGNDPGRNIGYNRPQEHTVDRNNRFSGVSSRKNR
jgi:hypothetical protein